MRLTLLWAMCVCALPALSMAQAGPWEALGRQATAAEIKAWNIDVRGDFQGLPKGAGTVAKGQEIWDGKCASCHGYFGESNEVFAPIVGGTSKEDAREGRVAALAAGNMPQRTTMMKLAKLSTLWDYINRAMPWNAPKSLTTEEVYAVTAYVLNLAEIVPADFTLSDQNIADVERRLPNRNGLKFYAALWNTRGRPDVKNVACMKNCATDVQIKSAFPDFARNSHGNLAEQNRLIGAVRGADTAKPVPASLSASIKITAAEGPESGKRPQNKSAAPAATGASDPPAAAAVDVPKATELVRKNACMSCHAVDQKLVGPAYKAIAEKYGGDTQAHAKLMAKIKSGGTGVWGQVSMPPQAQLKFEELRVLADWILAGAPDK